MGVGAGREGWSMTWVWLDDRFDEHAKFVKAMDLGGDAALCLWLRGLTYCNRNNTDGVLPFGMVRRLTMSAKPDRIVEALVDAGLWHCDELRGGYAYHDYLDYQPSAEEVAQRKADRAAQQREAGRRGGLAKARKAKRPASEPLANPLANPGEPLANPLANPGPSPSPSLLSLGQKQNSPNHTSPPSENLSGLEGRADRPAGPVGLVRDGGEL